MFQRGESKIIIQFNLKIVNYLNVTIKFADSSYRSFNKKSKEINQIHKQSNHPSYITK